jgi:GxxExxY protein
MKDALLKQEGYDLIGAAFEVYNQEGHGFLEEVYQECLEIELELRSIPFKSQPGLKLNYKGRELKKRYRPDLYVFDGIVVELKAIKKLTDSDVAQLMNYLKATGRRVGYLINFGNANELEWKRIIL